MRERDLGTAAASALAWAGAAAFLVCLLVRKIAPYPRWDLLACLTLSAVAFLAWWLRATGRWRSPLGGVVPPAFGLKVGRWWWPPVRGTYIILAVWLLFVPFLLLGVSTADNTPQLAAITRHDYRFAPVTITKIHHKYRNQSKTGTTYRYMVTVQAPGPGGQGKDLSLRGEAESSSGSLSIGDRLTGGLYAPDAPSLGVILTNRRQVASLLGGPASCAEMTLLAAISAFPVGLFLVLARSGSKNKGGPLTPESVFGDRPARRLRVHIAGGTAGTWLTAPDPKKNSDAPRATLSPALRLSSPEGTRDLFIDRCLDPQALAGVLEGQAGWLYWAPDSGKPPEWSVAALLVLDDDRYVYGVTPPGSAEGLPQGEPVGLPLPDARPLRAVGPYALWQPAVHGPGMYGFGLGFLAVCLIVAGVDPGGGPLLSWCFVSAVGGPVAGLLLIRCRRTAYLRRLAGGP
ncbi:hypothetical protein K2224_21620 [Streptomyces sp. BHT-5-2]|uniref:hypothetical protein n=1 Tax=unclassified Streptomyces TaxID=2593676 RepID=UPI001C8DC299|nr:hypothetical protein [Streptomyces sp. BHT-5-2]QZL05417.1 hypothetical protein K2224_21620 [Streptomyces sp. BHT-5-2]